MPGSSGVTEPSGLAPTGEEHGPRDLVDLPVGGELPRHDQPPCDGHGGLRGMTTTSDPHRGLHLPAEVTERADWRHHCFSLRNCPSPDEYRAARNAAFRTRREVAGLAAAA